MQVFTVFFFSLGDVERSQIMDTFEIKECNILCCTRCYTNIHQVGGNVTVGNQTPTRAQAREKTDLNNAKMTRELGGLNKVCSKKVLADISSRQMPYSKVRQILS